MWRVTERFIASGQKRNSKEEMTNIMDPIQTPEAKYKKRFSFMLFLSLCFLGFANYIICFQSAIIGMAPMAKTSFSRTIKDLEERSMHLKKTCMNLQVKNYGISMRRLHVDKPNNLVYCLVPKCGSTYWVRFLQVLNNVNPQKDPFNTIRSKVHRTRMNNKLNKEDNLNETIRFLVTRSPYSRLYSAYVDKIFLPEFWKLFGRDIIKHNRGNASRLDKLCGNDATFAEFLKMIAHRDRVHIKWSNTHWLPITQLCDPCKYKYNFIIKQETFSRDRDYLVRKVGIKEQSILTYNNSSHWDYSLSVINKYIITIFQHFSHRTPEICYERKVLVKKIFLSLQIQGYIKEDARFDLNRFGDLKETSITSIAEVFQNIYRKHPVLTRHDWEEQRNTFRKKAYRLVDTDILEGIKKCYDLDFKIFNYDPEPEEIFGNRKKKTMNN